MTRKKPAFQWGEHDVVVHAWAEPCSGPGWSNSPIMVLVMDGYQHVRVEYLQPENLTRDMVTLYSTSAASHAAMTSAVIRYLDTWKRQKARKT